ncbi:uncharacterized protein CLUP02_12956 [Colletotrichum lupini]|uniref:Uncharacterized protein n=1 Tax=Colletotrichum lupini TaxID=145971 RepID=A0A9Q8T1I7_9PEZI|nr:uncharacterized protein CLUP02_12956 [Colletotrichum lupini]UQC87451.1 hypothetical protein CLUP02_12956 [Colletotrichum lupini]
MRFACGTPMLNGKIFVTSIFCRQHPAWGIRRCKYSMIYTHRLNTIQEPSFSRNVLAVTPSDKGVLNDWMNW